MIDVSKESKPIILGEELIMSQQYALKMNYPFVVDQLSEVAQTVLSELHPQMAITSLHTDRAEITALRILDFMSSKKGYICRKAYNFRNYEFYTEMVRPLATAITTARPLRFSCLSISVNLPNPKLTSDSPYPHMGCYIALENMHKIAVAIQEIYPPGIQFVLGFESFLYKDLYFLSEAIVQQTFAITKHLNEVVHKRISAEYGYNPIVVMDIREMVENSFGNYKMFTEEMQKIDLSTTSTSGWQEWYSTTIPLPDFPNQKSKDHHLDYMMRWHAGVNELKYKGGRFQKGFVGFSSDVFPFTPSGRRNNMIAMQMVPENACLPHQRAIIHDPSNNKWRLRPYEQIENTPTHYVPRFVEDYVYPFYFEEICTPKKV